MTNIANADDELVFGMIEENLDQLVSAEIIKIVYKKMGIPVDIVAMPGKRSLKESNEGHIDGEVSRISEVAEEFSNLIKVPTPINYIEPSAFTTQLIADINNCEALTNFSIAIVRGLKHAELCTKEINQVKVVNHLTKAFELLNAARVDIVITSKINGLYLSKKMGLTSVKHLTLSLSKLPVYHFVNKKYADLVPRINNVLLTMQANQELLHIRNSIVERLINDQQLNIYKI